jgi:hypothetical protein
VIVVVHGAPTVDARQQFSPESLDTSNLRSSLPLFPFALHRPPCRWTLTTSLLICRDLQSLTFDARLSKPSAKVAPATEDSPMDVDELLNSGSGLILDMTDFFG